MTILKGVFGILLFVATGLYGLWGAKEDRRTGRKPLFLSTRQAEFYSYLCFILAAMGIVALVRELLK
jgi:UPF0716 family protein affecting phage T7 exclusion